MRSFRSILLCLFVFFFSFVPWNFATAQKLHPSQYSSLQLLYYTTGGDNWVWQSNGTVWNFSDPLSSDPCESNWQGITCSESALEYTNISTLELSGYNLAGSLVENVFNNLTSLAVINFRTNLLSGKIPSSISNLTHLNTLRLSNNSFTGTIPHFVGDLKLLEVLSLSYNSLVGCIPQSISKLVALKNLFLGFNGITGEIPAFIGDLTTLEWISLPSNRLRSDIPTSIGKLSSLHTLTLYLNSLYGSIPESLTNLTALESLDLYVNSLSGNIPTLIGELTSLEWLNLIGNKFDGPIPESIVELKKLRWLQLSDNSFIGGIPQSIGTLTMLEMLYLDRNFLTGHIPPSLVKLVNLKELDLRDNFLTGEIPFSIGNVTNIVHLDLSANSLIGRLPESLSALKSVEHLIFRKNQLSGPIVDVFSDRLAIVDFSSNLLTGSIPTSIFQNKKLQTLSASDNCLSSILPIELCSALSLKELYLSGLNQNERCLRTFLSFTAISTLPDCLWSMKNLKKLYLVGNAVAGNIAHFQLDNLQELNLNSNRIYGTLPATLYNRSFDVFDISRNRITGYFHSNLYPLANDSYLNTEINRLSGTLLLDSVDRFQTVSVINGNIISCETIPENDENIGDYNCGTEILEDAIYIWLATLCLASFVLIFVTKTNFLPKVKLYLSEFFIYNKDFDEEIKIQIPSAINLIYTLRRLLKFTFCFATGIILLSVVLYPSLKFGPDNRYKTHFDQYFDNFSGLNLKSVLPACLILVFFLAAFSVLTGAYLRLFIVDWSLLFHTRISIAERPKPKSWLETFKHFFFVSCFVVLSIIINASYILAKLNANTNELVLIQIGIFIFNSLYRSFFLPKLIGFLFQGEDDENSPRSVLSYSILLSVLDILSPLIATVFTDDLCFHELNFINPQDGIAFTYSIQYCDIFDTDTEICEAYLKVDITTEISPPFVYSNQCRNAIIGNFLPLVIYLGLYKTFLYPFLYLWATWNIRDLYSEIKIFGIKVPLSTEKLVLGNIAFLMVNIFEEFSMLLLYGILSLYGAVVLGLSIMVQTLLLQGRIFRYYKLQKGGGILQSQKKQINIICESALSNFHAMIWPGLILVTLIFAIFLFDMAYDEDDKESLGGPLSIMFFAFVFSYAIRLIFLKKKNKLDVELDLKRSTLVRFTSTDSQSQVPMNPLSLSSNKQEEKNGI